MHDRSRYRRYRFDSAQLAMAARFAETLADVLHDLKLTHREVSNRLQVSLYTVDSWTRAADPKIPSATNLERLCALVEARGPGLGVKVAASAGLKWLPPPVQLHRNGVAGSALGAPIDPAVGTAATNLPVPLTSFIGREQAIADVRGLLGTARLVTLVGTGGIGKTRLAQEVGRSVADAFPNGVWFVDLAPVSAGDERSIALPSGTGLPSRRAPFVDGDVPQAIRIALGLVEQTGLPAQRALGHHLKDRHLLLILDNCEQVVDAVAECVEELLLSCPRLRVLATSRQPLGIAGEAVWRVPGLTLPDRRRPRSPGSLLEYEALLLFVERAASALPGFTLTAANAPSAIRICTRVEGLPLAIELAAAWVRTLGVDEIAERLDSGFGLLTRGTRSAPPRHRTIQASILWSYELLAGHEQALLRRVSVFVDGWTLDAAEQVCSTGIVADAVHSSFATPPLLDALAELVDKSLVSVEHVEGTPRYRLLQTIRQFAWERLVEQGEAEPVREAHARYFLAMAEDSRHLLRGPEQAACLERWEREHDNLRAALAWGLASDPVLALRLAVCLWPFWYARGHMGEGRKWLESALRLAEDAPLVLKAQALNAAGSLAREQGDLEQGEEMLEQSLALKRQIGAPAGVAASLVNLGAAAMDREQYERARELFTEGLALYTQLDDHNAAATCLGNLGNVARETRQYAEAMRLYEQCIELLQESSDVEPLAGALLNMGLAATAMHKPDEAADYCRRALHLFAELRDRGGVAQCLEALGSIYAAEGQIDHAARLLGAAAALRQEIAMPLKDKERQQYDELVSDLGRALGAPAFTQQWEAGSALSFDDMIVLGTNSET